MDWVVWRIALAVWRVGRREGEVMWCAIDVDVDVDILSIAVRRTVIDKLGVGKFDACFPKRNRQC